MRAEGLDMVQGIIDKDDGEQGDDIIHAIGRYSIENYLYDPLIIFACLTAAGKQPQIRLTKGIAQGDEHRIRELPNSDIQLIVDTIVTSLEPDLHDLTAVDSQREEVNFINGKSAFYPQWQLQKKCKMLAGRYREHFKSKITLEDEMVLSMVARVRLIPAELHKLINSISE